MTAHTLAIGKVTLTVHDLGAVASFYQKAVGLHLLKEESGSVALGTAGNTLLVLQRDPAARKRSAREAGLFHTAFLLPSRADLGRWIGDAINRSTTVVGASDHAVSEAIYLTDPEGNGIEIYADRPRLDWRWNNGEVDMPSDALQIEPILSSAKGGSGWKGFPDGTTVGHMHLQVGAIAAAESFYRDLLGLAVTSHYPGGTFYAADGYHHHLATNIWNSRGAGPRDLPSTGLADFELIVASSRMSDIKARAETAGSTVTTASDGHLSLKDPWGTSVTIVPAQQTN